MKQKLLIAASFLCLKTVFSQNCVTPTTLTLPPVAVCEGNCFVWHGEVLCTDTTVAWLNLPACQYEVQQLIIVPNTTAYIGTVAKISCTHPCVNYAGKNYCDTGVFSKQEGCVTSFFDIGFEKDTLQIGSIGKVTCAHPQAMFNGKSYDHPGNFMDENDCTVWRFSVEADQTKPVFFGLKPICDSGTEFRISFKIKEAQPPFEVNGEQIASNFYESEPLPNGTPYSFLVESIPTGCKNTTFGVFDCSLIVNPPPPDLNAAAAPILLDKPKKLLENEPTANTTFSAGTNPQNTPAAAPQIIINHTDEVKIFAPNALKINALSPNNRFTLFASDNGILTIKRLDIFDKNGQSVFSKTNFLPNQTELGWNGFLNEKEAAAGVFIWYAELEMANGECRVMRGDLTVVN